MLFLTKVSQVGCISLELRIVLIESLLDLLAVRGQFLAVKHYI